MWQRVLSVRDRSWAWFKERAHGPHAFWWLMLLSFLEPLFSPIVPETLMVAMLLAGAERWKFYALMTTIASIAGGVVGYFIGALLYKSVGGFIIELYGLESYVTRAQELFNENIFTTMAFVTATPVPDKVFVFFAGFLGVNFLWYLFGYIAGRSARIFLIAWLLKTYGPRILDIADKYFGWLTLSVVALIVIAILLRVLHVSFL